MVTRASSTPRAPEHALPPVAPVAVATMVLIVIGGIDVAAYLPRRAPLGMAIALVVAAGALLVANLAMVSRLRPFAWRAFFLVGGCALLAYVVIAGMLEYVFVLDHTPGSLLALLTAMLVMFAIDIPLLFGFSVARYQPPSPGGEEGPR